jgi:hypothetical protein
LKPDILFLAHNRLEFTQRSFRFLIEHTDWDRVSSLIVYDDASEFHSRLWIQDACAELDVPPAIFRCRDRPWGSPVAIMCDYLHDTPAEWFVKIDNDVAVCPGWLDELLSVVEVNPSIDLLGFEAGMTVLANETPGSVSMPEFDGRYGWEPSTHIGGVGLMRTEAFKRRTQLVAHGRYYGFTEWQHRFLGRLNRGWIKPDLPCPLLDRIPDEPFRSWSERYVRIGWQRFWPSYPDFMRWAYAWVLEKEAECVFA